MATLLEAIKQTESISRGKQILHECILEYIQSLNEAEPPLDTRPAKVSMDLSKKSPEEVGKEREKMPDFEGDLGKNLEPRIAAVKSELAEPVLMSNFIKKLTRSFVEPMKITDINDEKAAGNLAGLLYSFERNKRKDDSSTSFINAIVVEWLYEIKDKVSDSKTRVMVDDLIAKFQSKRKTISNQWIEFYKELQGAIPWLFPEYFKNATIQKALHDELQKYKDLIDKTQDEITRDSEEALKRWKNNSVLHAMSPTLISFMQSMAGQIEYVNKQFGAFQDDTKKKYTDIYTKMSKFLSDSTFGNQFLSMEAQYLGKAKDQEQEKEAVKKIASKWLSMFTAVKNMITSVTKGDQKLVSYSANNKQKSAIGGTSLIEDLDKITSMLKEITLNGDLSKLRQKSSSSQYHLEIFQTLKPQVDNVAKSILALPEAKEPVVKNLVKDLQSLVVFNTDSIQTGGQQTPIMNIILQNNKNNQPNIEPVFNLVKREMITQVNRIIQQYQQVPDSVKKILIDFLQTMQTAVPQPEGQEGVIEKPFNKLQGKPVQVPPAQTPIQQQPAGLENASNHIFGRLLTEAQLILEAEKIFYNSLDSLCLQVNEIYGMPITELVEMVSEAEEGTEESPQERAQRVSEFYKNNPPNIKISALQKIFDTKVFSKTGLTNLKSHSTMDDIHNITSTYIEKGAVVNLEMLHTIVYKFLRTAAGSADKEVQSVAQELLKKFNEIESTTNTSTSGWKGIYKDLEGVLSWIYAKGGKRGEYGDEGSGSIPNNYAQAEVNFFNTLRDMVSKKRKSAIIPYAESIYRLFFNIGNHQGLANSFSIGKKISKEGRRIINSVYDKLETNLHPSSYKNNLERTPQPVTVQFRGKDFECDRSEIQVLYELVLNASRMLNKLSEEDKDQLNDSSDEDLPGGSSLLTQIEAVAQEMSRNRIPFGAQEPSDKVADIIGEMEA